MKIYKKMDLKKNIEQDMAKDRVSKIMKMDTEKESAQDASGESSHDAKFEDDETDRNDYYSTGADHESSSCQETDTVGSFGAKWVFLRVIIIFFVFSSTGDKLVQTFAAREASAMEIITAGVFGEIMFEVWRFFQ